MLLIIEGLPKKDEFREGLILYEFLSGTIPEKVHFEEFLGSVELQSFLEDYDMSSIQFVHISGHGSADGSGSKYYLPQGFLRPHEFPENCFEDCTVTISACELGKKSFAEPFLTRTGAYRLISPQRKVEFIDSAFWYLHFYYFTLHHKFRPGDAYKRTQRHLSDKLKGAFIDW